jgi:hypothetical protein
MLDDTAGRNGSGKNRCHFFIEAKITWMSGQISLTREMLDDISMAYHFRFRFSARVMLNAD